MGEEKRRRRRRRREEKKEEGRKKKEGEKKRKGMKLFVWNFGRFVYGFIWILVWRFGIPHFV